MKENPLIASVIPLLSFNGFLFGKEKEMRRKSNWVLGIMRVGLSLIRFEVFIEVIN